MRVKRRSARPSRIALGGHERAGLGEQDEQRRLADVGALARHVGAGDDHQASRLVAGRLADFPCMARCLIPSIGNSHIGQSEISQHRVVGHEALAQRLLENRMPARPRSREGGPRRIRDARMLRSSARAARPAITSISAAAAASACRAGIWAARSCGGSPRTDPFPSESPARGRSGLRVSYCLSSSVM